jgi:predicted Zn-dependent protease
MPVKIYFANTGSFTDGNRQYDLKNTALEGFDQWKIATGGRVSYVVTMDSEEADIVVHFEQRSGSIQENSQLGLTTTIAVEATLVHADLNLHIYELMSVEEALVGLRETAAHEFGHALGIKDHSDNPDDVMFPTHDSDNAKQLTDRDVNTLKTAYCSLFTRSVTLPACSEVRTRREQDSYVTLSCPSAR